MFTFKKLKDHNYNLPTIILDADDTIWDISCIYAYYMYELVDMINPKKCNKQKHFISYDIIKNKLIELQSILIKEQGFTKEIFPLACMQTFEYFNQDGYNHFNSLDINYRMKWIHRTSPKYYNFNKELKQLVKYYNIYIVTKGDYEIQERKIKESGFTKYINGYYINNVKFIEDFQNLFNEISLFKGNNKLIFIGDSLRSDMKAGMYFNATCYWIKPENEFSYENKKDIYDQLMNYTDKFICNSNFITYNKHELGLTKVFNHILEEM